MRKEFLSELVGTAILLLFGLGVGAMTNLFTGSTNGGYTNIVLGWGLGVLFGILASKPSGSHLNPAVTIAFAVIGNFSWGKVGPYIVAQCLGAFISAAIIFSLYHPLFMQVDPSLSTTHSLFATYPNASAGSVYGFFDQILGTFLLLFAIMYIGDHTKESNSPAIGPILVALVVVAIGISFGGLHGYAINPARDLGPRIFTWLAGFQYNGFSDGVWLVPIFGPVIGGSLATIMYKLLSK